jgi:hypothetical protein
MVEEKPLDHALRKVDEIVIEATIATVRSIRSRPHSIVRVSSAHSGAAEVICVR